ncbi:PRAME family member 5-like [Urocitellus parryii]
MSIHSPPMLLELAGHSLMSNKFRAILELEDLPIELFPPLFVEAFSRGHTEVLKKMVQAWPFTCLPLGALMRKPHLEMIEVTLDGLDMLLAQQDHARRWKLQVLDLWNVPQMWSGVLVDACSPEDIKTNRTLKLGPAMAAKPPFKVFIDLGLRKRSLDEFLTHLFLWVRQRRDRLHLCCNRLKIIGKPTSYTRKIRNPRKLLVSKVYVPAYTSQDEQEQQHSQLTLQFLRMDCLGKFCANAVFLLEGHLEQLVRITYVGADYKMRVQCLGRATMLGIQLGGTKARNGTDVPSLGGLSSQGGGKQLRHLELRGIKLTDFSLEPLQILLHSTATTLNILDLAACWITDSQLQALLPALSHCSQLVILSIHGNHLSISTLSDLLLHTARLSQLSVELYPAPLESNDAWGTIHSGRYSQPC